MLKSRGLIPFFAVLLMFHVSGAHWLVLQSVAWTGMMIENIKNESLHQAVSKTFDGEHPCDLCTAIDEGKKSEKKQESQLPAFKKEFIDIETSIVFSPPLHFWENDEFSYHLILSEESPPTPPPQVV
jgi:hypothetical protein